MVSDRLRIAVSGFPGTGKTTLVRALGEQFNLPVIEERMLPIGKAVDAVTNAIHRGRIQEVPLLRERLIMSFLDWGWNRTNQYAKHAGFVADRWEADLVDFWLQTMRAPFDMLDPLTGQLLGDFVKKSASIDYAVITPLQKPFEAGVNNEGNYRKSGFTKHLVNTVTTTGLVHTFTKVHLIALPDRPMSGSERVDFVIADRAAVG